MSDPPTAPWRRLGELAGLFVALPLACLPLARWISPLAILIVAAIAAWVALGRFAGVDRRRLLRFASDDGRRLVPVLARWLLGSALLTVGLALWRPDLLWHLPRTRPGIWLAVIALYPLLSVLPQEILYRAFFFARYRALLGDGAGLLIANAVAFALPHLLFENSVALGLSFAGGLLFAATYRASGHLPLVLLEHLLYGWTVFTIGLDRFFLGAILPR